VSKKKREYNVRENITGRKESANISVGPRWVGEKILWRVQRAKHISLCAQFGNVAMYQNYIHDVIEKYVILICRMSLKNLLLHKTVVYRRLHF